MSWSIEEHIGECRPFPAQVVVYKGETDECLAYVSGEVADRLKAENTRLRELAGYMIRCMQEHHDCVDCLINGEQCDISCIESDLWELGIEVKL